MNTTILALAIGLASGLVPAVSYYSRPESSLLLVVAVYLGCAISFAWLATIVIGLARWFVSEVVLMGRLPVPHVQLTPLKTAFLASRAVGLALPFLLGLSQEGWSVFVDPVRWAVVPITLALSILVITFPLWALLRAGTNTIRSASSSS